MSSSFPGRPDRGAGYLRVTVVFLLLALSLYGHFAWQAYEHRAHRDEVLQLMKDVYTQCVRAVKEDPELAQKIEVTKSEIRSLGEKESFGLLVVFDSELAAQGCHPEASSPVPPIAKKRNPTTPR